MELQHTVPSGPINIVKLPEDSKWFISLSVCVPKESSSTTEKYFASLYKNADDCYAIAQMAREKGFDPAKVPEIKKARDLAERVEAQVGPKGVSVLIRDLLVEGSREISALKIAKTLAKKIKEEEGIERALEQAVRTSLSILTEGVLVAPTEGLVRVDVLDNEDGSQCAAIYYAGPIRAAGGTAQALSVLIADVVRRELGLKSYIPTTSEIERYKEEIPLYKRAVNLQYTPSSTEIETIIKSCPVCITGEPTEKLEVVGHRDLPRVGTNRIRGGAVLVIAEGLCLKANKILKHVERLEIQGWDFLKNYVQKKKEGQNESEGDHKYLKDVLVGRPIFSFPDKEGSFRLRYGRSRLTGLAAIGLSPVTMKVLDSFPAIGTQLKTQLPGKAAAITPCDSIEGPSVVLHDGSFLRLDDISTVDAYLPKIDKIIDLGEILISPGEFLENNHHLKPGGWCHEWWILEANSSDSFSKDISFKEALAISQKSGAPLHPNYTFFWDDLEVEEILILRNVLLDSLFENQTLQVSISMKSILERLGIFHTVNSDIIFIRDLSKPLLYSLALNINGSKVESLKEPDNSEKSLSLVEYFSGLKIKNRAPTRIGASMGRPEKANERRMSPPPHSLFPIGENGGPQRLINTALDKLKDGKIRLELELRLCSECNEETVSSYHCNIPTLLKERATLRDVNLKSLINSAKERLGMYQIPQIKCVKGLMSSEKTPELLEKGMLRAKYDLRVYKDGTLRYDMMNLPMTHFYPCEIGLSVEKARGLGYLYDYAGNELTSADQLVALNVQDVVLSRKSSSWLLNVARFIDEELEKIYGLDSFYSVPPVKDAQASDMIGTLLIGLSPHTSAGVLCRLIGFTEANAQYSHPFFHAAKRRNCDGDEDCFMLLLDGLLNYSEKFLPNRRGGTMDTPRVLMMRINPKEIDSEAHNIDLESQYSLSLYQSAELELPPKKIANDVVFVSNYLEDNTNFSFSFTHSTSDINSGPKTSRYVELGSMQEKSDAALNLASKIRASDATYLATQTLNKHLLRDLVGNLRSFSKQNVRCRKCNTKYRRPPLSNKCSRCGAGIILNISRRTVFKYRKMASDIINRYPDIDNFTQQRLELALNSISDALENDEITQTNLGEFF